MVFIDRERELGHLNAEYGKNGAKFIVIYGRRRVGKTTLIEEFLRSKKDIIYYTADQQLEQQQIEDFKRQVAPYARDEFLEKTRFENWDQFFSYLSSKVVPKDKRLVLAIDEVTYIIKNNPAFPSILQKYWDKCLSKTNVFLLISGSLVGLMLKDVLSYGSPLYGRRTSQMQIEPFDLKTSSEFLKGRIIEDKIAIYSLVGGVAKYLVLASEEKSVNALVKNKFLEKEGFFYQEGLFLMAQEFKNPTVYMSVLKAISMGNSRLNEIANFVGVDGKKISMYLDILQTLGLVSKIVPVTEDEDRFRGAVYRITDNFLRFWFRFVFPNRSQIELHDTAGLQEQIRSSMKSSHIPFVFEDVSRELLAGRQSLLPFEFSKMGNWWGAYRDKGTNERKTAEIDIVALNEKTGKILFAECKWRDLKLADAVKILDELKKKSEFVSWKNDDREEYFGIIARKLDGKIELKKKGFLAIDLADF